MRTKCECIEAGWCKRHQCKKPAHMFQLCQTRSDYFKLWEEGMGPGQPKLKSAAKNNRKKRLKDFSVAVIIVSHNYARFLKEAIESALTQTYRPLEILVVDDSSTDNTKEITDSYQLQGVQYHSVSVGNVHQSRRAGFEETRAEVLCFLDADDMLPQDYIEKGLEQFCDEQVAVVYSDVKRFGHNNSRSKYPEKYSHDLLQQDNYIHAGSLVLREALHLSRVFEQEIDPIHTQGDWFLWRGVLRENWIARKQSGLYFYRIHGKNWGSQTKHTRRQRGYFDYAGLEHETITLFISLTGNLSAWESTASFLERQTWPRHQISLVLMDTSQNESFSTTIREWTRHSDYDDVRYLKFDTGNLELSDEDENDGDSDQQARCKTAQIYNRMIRLVDTNYVWILEEDLLPPDNVCRQLLTNFNPYTACVTAPCHSHFHEDDSTWDKRDKSSNQPDSQSQIVGGYGFGCTILRTSLLQDMAFTAQHKSNNLLSVFCQRLQNKEFRANIDWSCISENLNAAEPNELSHPKTQMSLQQ